MRFCGLQGVPLPLDPIDMVIRVRSRKRDRRCEALGRERDVSAAGRAVA